MAGGVAEGNVGGNVLVLADEEHGQFPDARHVQAFMKRTIVHRAIAKKRHGDPVVLQKLETVSRPRRLENAWPNDAACAHQPDFRCEEVHASSTSARTAR